MNLQERIDDTFSRLAAGDLTQPATAVQDGWEVDLPSGKTVTRSVLQAEAQALVALGPDAVPPLLPWADNANPALRYVATVALEQITGIKSSAPYLAQSGQDEQRRQAIDAWRAWYQARADGCWAPPSNAG